MNYQYFVYKFLNVEINGKGNVIEMQGCQMKYFNGWLKHFKNVT